MIHATDSPVLRYLILEAGATVAAWIGRMHATRRSLALHGRDNGRATET